MKNNFMKFTLMCWLLLSSFFALQAQDCNLTDLFVLPVCEDAGSVNLMVTFYGSDKYSFTDGVNTYDELGQGIHVFEGLTPGNTYTLTLTDMENSNCKITKELMMPSCHVKCHSNPGLLMSNSGTNICENGRVSIDSNGFTLSDRQKLYYLFHTAGPDLSKEDFPLDESQVVHYGNYLDNTEELNGKIWATSFVAQTGFEEIPDFSDPCLLVSNTIEINFLEPITINHTPDCNEDEGTYNFDVTINGGLPQINGDAQYTINSPVYSGLLSAGQNLRVGPIPNGTSYYLFVSDLNFCASQSSIEMVNCTKVMPIELITFEGEAIENGNVLKWVTGSEVENDFFTIFKSIDGVNFDKIHVLEGNGTSNSTNHYQFLDRNTQEAMLYYKLTQTDYDGTQHEKGIISVNRELNYDVISNFSTNLITNELLFTFNTDVYQNFSLSIINIEGKIVKKMNLKNTYSSNNYSIKLAELPVGIYYAHFTSNNFVTNKLFLKK